MNKFWGHLFALKKKRAFSRKKSKHNSLKHRFNRFIILTITVAYWMASLGYPSPVVAQMPTNFICDGTLYISQARQPADDTILNTLDRSPGVFQLVEQGSRPNVRYNGMGFNVKDNFIYGIDPDQALAQTVYRIGQTGEAESLGQPVGLPTPADGGRFFAGDFDGDGNYYIYSASRGELYRLNVTTTPPTVVGAAIPLSTDPGVDYADIAFNPTNGLFYGIRTDNRELSQINPTNGSVRAISTAPTPGANPNPFGAVFFDAFGNLFAYENGDPDTGQQGTLYIVDVNTGDFQELGNAQGVSRNDGAACAFAPQLLKTVEPSPAMAGDIVTYTYRLANRTALDPLDDLTFEDIMPDDGRTFVPGSQVISPNNVTVDDVNISSDNRTFTITGLSIPNGTIAEITVQVQLPSNIPAGQVLNQATVTGLPVNFGGPDLRSDFPFTGGFPDETPLDIVESPAIGVAKQVANNVDNGDGTHTVTYNIKVDNLGNTPLEDVSLTENLADTFNGVDDFTVDSISLESITEGNLTVNQNFNGEGDTSLLNNSQTQRLEFNGTATIQLVVTVTPGNNLGPFENTVEATATSPSGTSVDDESDNGTETDPNPDDGNPGGGPEEDDPTPVTFGGGDNPAIGVAKSVGATIPLGGGRFRVTYNLLVENLGDVSLSNVELVEDLNDAFGRDNFTVSRVTSPTLTTNPNYDGSNNINLLGAGNTLDISERATVQLIIEVTPPDLNRDYENQVEAIGTPPDGTPVSDLSDNNVPTDDPTTLQPDPNGNNRADDPGEDEPTPLNFSDLPENPAIGVAKNVASISSEGDTFIVTYDIAVENLGNVTLSNVQLTENLNEVFEGLNFSVSSLISSTLTVNENYNGDTDINLLAGGNTLDVGETNDVRLVVRVAQPDLSRNYENQVEGTGTSPDGNSVNDLSYNGFPSDPDGDGNANEPEENTPTPVNFSEVPAIGVAKNAIATTPLGSDRFLVTYELLVKNVGNVPLRDVQLVENLNDTFGAGNFTVINTTSPDLTLNPDYDGSSNINLLGTDNNLSVGETETMQLVVDVTPPNLNRDYENQVRATGLSPSGTSVDDFSDDATNNGIPTDPDSINGDGNANDPENENTPTSVTFTNTPENPGIGVAKSVGTVQDNGDGTFTIPYTIVVENLGNTELTDVQVTENLFGNNRSTFAGTQNVQIDDLSVTGALSQVNPSFDGNNDQNLLSGQESLNPNQTASITLNVRVTPGRNFGPFENSAVAIGNRNGRIVADGSIPGTNPDRNSDGNPGNDNQPTVVSLGQSNLRLVKRITEVFRNGVPLNDVNLDRVVDDPNDPDDNVGGWSALPNGLLGVFNLGTEVSLQSGDEVEYTIYYLSDGGPVVNDVQICDAIPEQTSFVTNTIELNETSLTDNADTDQGTFFGELTPVTPPCPNPDNPNGSVFVNVGDVPSTAPNNVGFVRFRVTID
ncbi:DUF6923 family protein [Coleofasciculus sp.]|uniref:DUF6923 family protein n=1 Tax=Coleofasciculus sp. TaxID=3100458 RepID=UPI003A3F35B8